MTTLLRLLCPALLPLAVTASLAEPPRAVPAGQLPKDVRLAEPKDLDGYFPFSPPDSREVWQKRRVELRRQLLTALGIFPLPDKTALNPVIHGKRDQGDYTIEKVYFESMPGFFVTGSLYRPRSASGKAPGILCPHGHWPNGRFMSLGEAEAQKELKSGAETLLCAAKSPLQARCVQLARMGCVVFHYDMIGYADSLQLSFELAHRFGKQRPEMNEVSSWGFFSPPAEGRLQSIMGLQAWSSIRSLDFLTSLPDVDAARLGVTGASGGGTQTFILAAIDDRPAVAFPAVMVGTAMQGGCTCENCSLLRVGTGNVEIAGLFAPKPLGMTAADDWTKEMATKGFPEMKRLYTLLGAPEQTSLTALTQFPHNYNLPSRQAMYGWFARHLLHGAAVPDEREFQHLKSEDLTVWDAQHPAPKAADPDYERRLLKQWDELNSKALAKDAEAQAQGIRAILGRDVESSGKVSFDMTGGKHDRGEFLEMVGVVKNETHQEELPTAFFHPKKWNGKVALIFTGHGKSALYAGDQPGELVRRFLQSGWAVCGCDLLFQGEFLADGKAPVRTRKVKNPREAPAYTFGYNPTLFAQRVHDVLTLVRFVQTDEHAAKGISLVALGEAGAIAAAASSQFGSAVESLAAEYGTFSFASVDDYLSPSFLPGALKYGDLHAMLAQFKGRTVDLASVLHGKDLFAWKWVTGP